jgi:hypothetical protein
MGPIALFDKSFLQSLNLDESVWFDQHFTAVVSPVFYIETLADLAKDPTPRGSAEASVRAIAAKFPEMSGSPCANHFDLCVGDLLGHPVPMTGQIPLAGGRNVISGTRKGVVFDVPPETEAFQRWQKEEFGEIERRYAQAWRKALTSLDMAAVARVFQALGLDGKRFKSLEEIKSLATDLVSRPDKAEEQLKLAVVFLNIERHMHAPLVRRWYEEGRPPLVDFAPYAAFVLSIEIFFQLALAANLISSDRPSNRTDIAYLFYLPFSMVFISGDNLHRRCARLFTRADQRFVWAPDLKKELTRLNEHYLSFPEHERERGLFKFADRPPDWKDSLITQLWDQFMSPRWRDRSDIVNIGDPEVEKQLVDELMALNKAPALPQGEGGFDEESTDSLMLTRRVRKKKGSWWQMPKDLPTPEDGTESEA